MRRLLLIGWTVVLPGLACDTEPPSCAIGGLDCACTEGGSCDPGLQCNATNICRPSHGDDEHPSPKAEEENSDEPPPCDQAAIEDSVLAFCAEQTTPEPTPGQGETGTPCSDTLECDGICLDDYPYDGFGTCGSFCDMDSDCPFGYGCQVNGGERLCIEDGCWVPHSADACISKYLERHDLACEAGCGESFAAWFACLRTAGPLCFESDAEACNVAKGLFDHCCSDFGCD